jgi:hypothetical protein
MDKMKFGVIGYQREKDYLPKVRVTEIVYRAGVLAVTDSRMEDEDATKTIQARALEKYGDIEQADIVLVIETPLFGTIWRYTHTAPIWHKHGTTGGFSL